MALDRCVKAGEPADFLDYLARPVAGCSTWDCLMIDGGVSAWLLQFGACQTLASVASISPAAWMGRFWPEAVAHNRLISAYKWALSVLWLFRCTVSQLKCVTELLIRSRRRNPVCIYKCKDGALCAICKADVFFQMKNRENDQPVSQAD